MIEISKGKFDDGWALCLSISYSEDSYSLTIDLGKYYFNIWLLDKGVE